MSADLTFLKLGGSLITDKGQAATALTERIQRLAAEIAEASNKSSETTLLLGHGSGSFGHFAAKEYGTRAGVRSAADWAGFVEVWRQAKALHEIVMAALQEAGLPAISFPPSASIAAEGGQIRDWNLRPIEAALEAGLIPVVYGDVVFDRAQGGGILSTEELFVHLSRALKPKRILLAADEAVYADYPARQQLVAAIKPADLEGLAAKLSAGEGSDVTGGMLSKVEAALEMVAGRQDSEVRIFAGQKAGSLKAALQGEALGTAIRAR